MALRCLKLLKHLRSANKINYNLLSTAITDPVIGKQKLKEYQTENNIIYYEDPDTFGTLSKFTNKDKVILEDEGDIKEEKHISELPLKTQKLTTYQYADIIKQYLKHKRLKEAINVLEVRMLQEDRVKPENYIYNILIGACADYGYTKKAFKLYNEMKRRALKPTGDTYTCLFDACSNSPWSVDGIKNAKHLRELMHEKGIEPNLTNYNAMIKAFGRCGDLTTAFQIVDEMTSKKIKIRVHTFNHLIQACISDKENGLRHALIVWRKMLKMREKPNIYSFNLMLKCVKDCNLGSREDIMEMIGIIQQAMITDGKKIATIEPTKLLTSQDESTNAPTNLLNASKNERSNELGMPTELSSDNKLEKPVETSSDTTFGDPEPNAIINSNSSLQIVEKPKEVTSRTVPNLLSRSLQMQQVLSLQEVHTVQDKFAVIGGQEDFLNEMQVYSVKPDIKTFSQMLPLLDNTTEAEEKLMETMKSMNIFADIDFYNMLIKKRCLRFDYAAALDVSNMIEKESKLRKRKYSLKKKLQLKPNVMTYGVLAMACNTQESAEKLLNDLKEAQLKVNITILGTLLRHGTSNNEFGYVMYIMDIVKEENIKLNSVFLKHLEDFNDKCTNLMKSEGKKYTKVFADGYKKFSKFYRKWLKEINVDEVLKPEHPWAQFNETYPETVQRQNIVIKEPKKFYKRNRKFVKYTPPIVN